MKFEWTIEILNTITFDIRLKYLIATVDEVKKYLFQCIQEDKKNFPEVCEECPETIDEIKVKEYYKSGKITELSAEAFYDGYSMTYRADNGWWLI